MRQQGRLTEWNDDRGFGFITPLGEDSRVFAHISAFPRDTRRPIATDLVTFISSRDDKNRPRASEILFLTPTRPKQSGASASHQVSIALPLGGLAICLAASLLISPSLTGMLLLGYMPMSVATYAAYGLDKRQAKRGGFRTEESALHLMALLGGWPGALLAQRAFRHKTVKREFQVGFWVTVVINFMLLLAAMGTTASSPG